MSEYFWDNQIEYIKNTRELYYNDDYLQFLIERVWRIDKPVNILDFGCGYGFLGLKLLSLLPAGSTYTGVDKGKDLINKAREVFRNIPNKTEFIEADLEQFHIEGSYDIAICHAFLLHMKDPTSILKKMIQRVVHNGTIICFEPHWIANMANYRLHGVEQSRIVPLGNLQKLYEHDAGQQGKDGNIGMNIPVLLSQLGVNHVECRVSDRVNFLDQNMDIMNKRKLYQSLREEGIGHVPGDRAEIVSSLVMRGLTEEEANSQFEAELLLSQQFDETSWFTYAPNMKISFGIITRE